MASHLISSYPGSSTSHLKLEDTLHLWVVSFITLFCKVTFLVKFYLSIHTETCIYHKCTTGRISTCGHVCVISTQIKKQDMTRSPDTCPQEYPLSGYLKPFCHFFWAIWNLKVFTLERGCIFLIFRTKLIIYLSLFERKTHIVNLQYPMPGIWKSWVESFLKISQVESWWHFQEWLRVWFSCASGVLVSKVEYKKDLESSKGRSINYCETPQFRNVSKISKFTSDLRF